jgi:hypothetical protein
LCLSCSSATATAGKHSNVLSHSCSIQLEYVSCAECKLHNYVKCAAATTSKLPAAANFEPDGQTC